MSDTPRGPRSRRPGLRTLGLALAACVLVALVVAPRPAFAHASLSDSNPAANSTGPAPKVITLKFTKTFSVVSPGIQLLDGSGTVVPSRLTIDGTTATLTPDTALSPGPYGVKWTVKAPDSHARSGSFTFAVAGAGATGSGNLARALRTPSTTVYDLAATFGRFALLSGVMLVIGAIAVAYFVARASAREAGWLVLCARRASLLIGLGALITLFAEAGLHAGPGVPWPWRLNAWTGTLGSVWGLSFLCFVIATALLVRAPRPRFVAVDTWLQTSVGVGGRGDTLESAPPLRPHPYVAGRLDVRSGGFLLAAIALLTVGLAINGHSQSSSPLLIAWLADSIHVLATGVWAGGIALLLAVIARRSRANEPGLVTDAVVRFSVVATVASIAAGISGALLAVIELPGVSSLFTTTFGRILIVKVLIVMGIAGLGAYHHFVLLPRLQADPGLATARATWKTLRYEAVGFAVVVVLSAFLVGAGL